MPQPGPLCAAAPRPPTLEWLSASPPLLRASLFLPELNGDFSPLGSCSSPAAFPFDPAHSPSCAVPSPSADPALASPFLLEAHREACMCFPRCPPDSVARIPGGGAGIFLIDQVTANPLASQLFLSQPVLFLTFITTTTLNI